MSDIYKPGNYLESGRGKIVLIESVSSNKFLGTLITNSIPSEFYEVGLATYWSKSYTNWKLCKVYNTPLWKALNG